MVQQLRLVPTFVGLDAAAGLVALVAAGTSIMARFGAAIWLGAAAC